MGSSLLPYRFNNTPYRNAHQADHSADLVTLDELAISNMWETSALVELLERKGILTKIFC